MKKQAGADHPTPEILNSSFCLLHFLVAPVPQQLQGGFRKPVFVGASPTRGSSLRSEPAQAESERRMPSIALCEGGLSVQGSEPRMAGQTFSGS